MKRLLFYTIIILAAPCAFVYWLCDRLDFYTPTETINNLHYALTPSTEENDVIYLGNSRALLHINPYVLDSITGLKGYNLGLDGANMVYFNMVLQSYLANHPKPKYIVMTADPSGLNVKNYVYNYLQYKRLFNDSLVYHTIGHIYPWYAEWYNKFLLQSELDDRQRLSNILGAFRKKSDLKVIFPANDANRGFVSIDARWEDTKHDAKPVSFQYHNQSFTLLNDIISTCQARGIRLILICPPLYKDYRTKVINYAALTDSIRHIAAIRHTPYWEYTNTYMSDTTAYFYNVEHLNIKGAHIFSTMLGSDIRMYMADSTYTPDIQHIKAK